MRVKSIAIDGPAGAGKSTVAKLVAKKLAYLYVDTGAMYRAIAYKALKKGIAFSDEEALSHLARNCELLLKDEDTEYKVFCDGEDISSQIRLPQVGAAASPVSAVAGVRLALVDQQKKMAETNNVVMDGRDIGTVVLPHSQCKIFLTASLGERAKRRTKDLEAKGIQADINKVREEIAERDERDSSRANSPLKKADDAILLDTTNLTIEETAKRIIEIAKASEGVKK